MRVLKIGTKISYMGDEYTVTTIRLIDCGLVMYDVKGSGLRQTLTSLELGEIDDPKITVEAKECWYYGFKDGEFREYMGYLLPTLTGKYLVYAPNVRRVLEEDDLDFNVGKCFDVALSVRNMDKAREMIMLAMNDRINAA